MPKVDIVDFLTILLPGFLVAAGAWLLLTTSFTDTGLYAVTNEMLGVDWLGPFVIILVASLLGQGLATALGHVESHVLDREAAARLGLTGEEYDREWDTYVETLDKTVNPYISRLVVAMHFESRAGTGLLVFGLAWVASWPSGSELMAAIAVLLLAVWLRRSAYNLHYGLAEYRHRRFKSSYKPNHVTGIGEVVLRWNRGKLVPPVKPNVRFRVGVTALGIGAWMLRATFNKQS